MCIAVSPVWGWQVPWNCSYRQLWAALWMLEIAPGSSGRAVSTLNCWVISPVPLSYIVSFTYLWCVFVFVHLYSKNSLLFPSAPQSNRSLEPSCSASPALVLQVWALCQAIFPKWMKIWSICHVTLILGSFPSSFLTSTPSLCGPG